MENLQHSMQSIHQHSSKLRMKGATKNNSTDSGKTESRSSVKSRDSFWLKKKKVAGRPEVFTEKEYDWANFEDKLEWGGRENYQEEESLSDLPRRKNIQPVFCIPGILLISPLQSQLTFIKTAWYVRTFLNNL